MLENVDEKVSVIATCEPITLRLIPAKIRWRGRVYDVSEIGFRHPVRDGRQMHHVFEVTDGSLAFRLKLDTESLQWTLEKVTDGLAT